MLANPSRRPKPASSGNELASSSSQSKSPGREQPKSTDSGNKSSRRGQKRRVDNPTVGESEDRLTTGVGTPQRASRSRGAKAARVTDQTEVADHSSEEEGAGVQALEGDDGDEGDDLFSDENMELLEVYGFRPNWLDAIAENCNREIAQGVLNLCRLLQDRQRDVDRLKYSLSMFGIVDSQ